jgi:hypothetical protein
LGLITPDQDRFDPFLYKLSRQERLKKFSKDSNARLNFLEQIPVKKTALLHSTSYFNVQLNNLLITGGIEQSLVPGIPSRNRGLSTKLNKGEYIRIRDIQINIGSTTRKCRSRNLPEFLREDGFPLKESYADGDPLTSERGGIIVNDKGKIRIIYPKYFVQRRLIDDEGNLLHFGLDENFGHSPVFEVSMRPSVSRLLIQYISAFGYVPILRYRSFPYASDFMLPILDTPMSCNGWADLLIDTRGEAKLFVAKENTHAEWYELMNKLRQLLYSELAKKDYHLLSFTKDKTHLHQYLSQKMRVLEDYYLIQDYQLF